VLEKEEQPKELQTIDAELKATNGTGRKKPFVEPEVTVPVDVLEATTFQQAVATGQTN
jgi:hypothetical protein